MSLFSHNKCGKKLGAGLIFYFTFYLFGGCVRTQRTPAYRLVWGIRDVHIHLVNNRRQ